MLLASGLPQGARGDGGATTQVDAYGLLYGEKGRARVVEPTVRVTHLFPDGQSLSAQLGIDVITGASPSGAMPSGRIQTTTTPSGNVRTLPANQIPTSAFRDVRGALDLEWQKPFWGVVTSTAGGHFSREKDYQSLGATWKLSLDTMHRLTTLSVGVGVNRDGVFPVGGTPLGLSDGTQLLTTGSNRKDVTSGMVGISRVLTRRWMMGLNLSRGAERGYLTEPYKVVSLLDGASGETTGQLTEQRPSSRDRSSVLVSSVYHLARDVTYLSYRYYWDDWGVVSHVLDARYRHQLQNEAYLQPHLRLYTQGAADFFTYGLLDGTALPRYASSDGRLGALRTVTLGATYGFHVPGKPGEFTLRAEYIRQWGNGHPDEAVGIQRELDLLPAVDIGSVGFGYSVTF